MAEKMNDTMLMGNVYNNIVVIYKDLGKRSLASESYFKALKIFSDRKFEKGIASCYTNIAVILDLDDQEDAALDYDLKALAIFRKTNNDYGINTCYNNIGEIYAKKKNPGKAIQYFDSSLALSQKRNDIAHMKDTYEGLYKIYEEKHDYAKAFSSLKMFLQVRDSVFGQESAQRSLAMDASYEMKSKQNEIEALKNKDEIKELDLKKKQAWIVVLVLGVLDRKSTRLNSSH